MYKGQTGPLIDDVACYRTCTCHPPLAPWNPIRNSWALQNTR